MTEPNDHAILIAFGSNQGDSEQIYQQVQALLPQLGIEIVAASQPMKTVPVGSDPADKQDVYLNAAILGNTEASPEQTIEHLLEVEKRLGRVRDGRWKARTVDLDLLLYGQQLIDKPGLICPHPRMSYRRFVLAPAAEVAPEMVHPVSGCTMMQLFRQLDQRQNLVLWVGDTSRVLGDDSEIRTPLGTSIRLVRTDSDATSNSTEDQYRLREVNTIESFERLSEHAKLVVVDCDSQSEDPLVPIAVSFAGAVLRFERKDIDPQREFLSAIDAMS